MREGKKKRKKKRKKEVADRRYLRKIPRDPEEFITGTWLGAGVSPSLVEGISFQRWMPLNRTPPRTLSHGNSSLNAFPTISFPLSFRVDFDIPSRTSVFFLS